jgi:hypothetical protein
MKTIELEEVDAETSLELLLGSAGLNKEELEPNSM